MSAAAEIQTGKAEIYGIQNDGTALTVTAGATALIGNIQNLKSTEEWAEAELSSQDGSIIESIIASRRRRKVTLKIIPNGASRSAAQTLIDALAALGPNAVITTTHFKSGYLNTTYNYKGGGSLEYSSEGWAVSDITLETYETATAGTFAALAIAT